MGEGGFSRKREEHERKFWGGKEQGAFPGMREARTQSGVRAGQGRHEGVYWSWTTEGFEAALRILDFILRTK